jgi:peptidoglycan/xylan/chitin deacetylase (PgdA/CDA1 family)
MNTDETYTIKIKRALGDRLYEVREQIKHAWHSVMDGEAKSGKAEGLALSFDDDYVDDWYSFRDLFNRYGAKVTFFVSNFNNLTKESIEKLKILKDDGHEIGFHGLNHLDAIKFMDENSIDKYLAAEILPGIDAMTVHGLTPLTFSYPFGQRAPHIDKALSKHFKYLRGVVCTNGKKRIYDFWQIYYYHDNDGLLFAAGIDNVYRNNIDEIHEALRKARKKKKTILLYGHRTTEEAGDYCISAASLEAILKYASQIGMTFYRITDL